MNRMAIRTISLMLAVVLLVTVLPLPAIASIITAEKTTSISNDYIQATVDNATGRFSIRTVDGQPIRKKDGNVDLIFEGDNPETSFTTFKIDGTDFIFGNPYKLAPTWFSEVTPPTVVTNADASESLVTVWTIKGIRISQIITLIQREDPEQAGNVRIFYQVDNTTGATVEIGSRILLDTSIGGNDGPAFQIGQNYLAPLSTERRLVHEPEKLGYDIVQDEQAYNLHKLPAYWVMRDRLDLSNPLATNVIAYGFNNLFEGGIHLVDEMIVGHWSGLAGSKWDYEPNEQLDFTLDTNNYGAADTAVAYYWQPDPVAAGASKTYEVVYGIGEIVAPDKVFDIRFLDTVQKLETTADREAYTRGGIFEINAEIENLEMYDLEHSKILVKLQLERGLTFVDEDGRELGSSVQTAEFRKEVPPEQAAQGVEVIPYQPGEIIAAKWRVKATGRPWPTTLQYMMTVSSPETERELNMKLTEAADEEQAEIRAIYESSKANFVFLPPLGDLRQTVVYAITPKNLYYEDDKLFSLNVTNAAAYDPGSKALGAEANFDLHLKHVMSGERYKVPVNEAVTIQALGSGFTGNMRIAFRQGEIVDVEGWPIGTIKAEDLPLGEYSVIVDFKDQSNPEIAEALSFESNITFQVTMDEEVRLREAAILSVSKRMLDLTADDAEDLERFAEALPGAYGNLDEEAFIEQRASDMEALEQAGKAIASVAKLYNRQLSLEGAIDPEEVPVYFINTFESEEEFEEFKEALEEEADNQEVVLEVRGNILQSTESESVEYTVNTDAEPAIINNSVAYRGKTMTFSTGSFPLASYVHGDTGTPFLNALFVGGDGTLSIANSGFVFHKGEWTIDFYNGFDKSLGGGSDEDEEAEAWEEARNPEDDSLNGSLGWANGLIADGINPFHNLLISHVFFNRHSLFAAPSFSIEGVSLQLRDFILINDGVSFGGVIKFLIVEGEIENVIFNQEGFVGIDSSLSFELDSAIGLFDEDSDDLISGGIAITHYLDPEKYDVENRYGIEFAASLDGIMSISVELAFKQVADGRILPDVFAFGTDLPDPGIMVYTATYISSIRGAIRELADTIAGGKRNIPLTLEAGIDLNFGIVPALFSGSVDLTLKATGIKIEGSMGLGQGDFVMEMLSEALIQAQWVSPMFLAARAKIDVSGWGIIVGKGSLFVGENLEKRRIDFEGIVGARLQIPPFIPIIGGVGFGIEAGVNNDKLWTGLDILFFTLVVTYYWGGGVTVGTDGSVDGKDALVYLQIDDPERGPRIMAVGEGVTVLATSRENMESDIQEVRYHAVADGIDMIDGGSQNLGIGGIVTSNGSKVHLIPMNKVTGDALLEIEYDETQLPKLTFVREDASEYEIVIGDILDKNATAFEQVIPALREGDENADGSTVTRQQALESTDIRRLYVAVPNSEAKTGNWTLTSDRPIRTKLMNIPLQAALTATAIETDADNPDQFTASWAIKNASVGDTISLYLSKDPMPEVPTPDMDIDPGLMIARHMEVRAGDIESDGTVSGSLVIDVSQAETLGGADIRGLLAQGEYYLRTELRNETAFSAMSSDNTFRLVDPLAPDAVEAVELQAAGNGMFNVAFSPVAHKSGQENAEYGYVFTALDEEGRLYAPLGEIMYTEEQLESSLADGKYHLSLGGWSLVGKPKLDQNGKLLRGEDGNLVMDNVGDRYAGLETGRSYSIGVRTVRIPSDQDGASDNMRFAETVYSGNVLLPAPAKPVLSVDGQTLANNRYSLVSNAAVQELVLTANQPDVEVEAYVDDERVASVLLAAAGESGQLKLDPFSVDGSYAVELRARNRSTGDYSVSMLYLTVDTTAPMIHFNSPAGGLRSQNGSVQLKGRSNADAILTVSDADTGAALVTYQPNAKGEFAITVPILSEQRIVRLRIEAEDAAGNVNSAVTEVANDDLALPKRVKLVVPQDLISGSEAAQLEAIIEYVDGGVALADPSKLTFTVEQGDSNVSLSQDGTLVGRRQGNALIKVDYTPWEGLTLTDLDLVAVNAPEGVSIPTKMGTIKGYTAGTGNKGETRVLVTSPGHDGNMTGSELAYRVYASKDSAIIPAFDQDISTWKTLPASQVIRANPGDYVVVAKRLQEGSKLTLASSAALPAHEYIASPVAGANPLINIGGVNVDLSRGGSKIKLPILLNDNLTNNLIVADIKKDSNGGYRMNVAAEREAFQTVIDKRGTVLSLPVKGDIASLRFELDAELVRKMQAKEVTLDIETDSGRYILNPKAIDLQEIAASYPDMALEDIAIAMEVAQASAETIKLSGGASLVGEPVEFRIIASADGQSVELQQLAAFVDREIPLPAGVTGKGVSTAVVVQLDGTPRHVPTRIIVRDGLFYAHISSMSNSVYALINHQESFRDTTGHWAAEAIDDLAGRLIVSGTGDGLFQPSRNMTRAEFASILVNALGLPPIGTDSSEHSGFSDVTGQDWYYQAVHTAYSYGLIGGYGHGRFGPNDLATREQAMSIIARAMRLAGHDTTVGQEEAARILTAFNDASAISDWAASDVASVVKTGIISGQAPGVLAPQANATRAEIANAIRKMLQASGMID